MSEKIRIVCRDIAMTATLNDSKTSAELLKALPIESSVQRWGDEVYFTIPLKMGEEDPQAEVPSGAIAYWPRGPAFCIFFGQTPYSPVNVLGTVDGNAAEFRKVTDGDAIRIEKG